MPWLIPSEDEWRLLDRFLAGELTPAEQEVVVMLLARDSALQRLVRLMEGVPASADNSHEIQREVRRAWQELNIRMANKTLPERRSIAPRKKGLSLLGRHSEGLKTGQIPRPVMNLILCAAALVAAFGIFRLGSVRDGKLFWHSGRTSAPLSLSINEVTTRAGERASIRLADGTKVMIGPETELRLSDSFGHSNRSVFLKGEAMFDVAHTKAVPFTVYSGQSITRVLGTLLSVRAYNDTTVVAVVEGKVSLGSRQAATPSAIVTGGYVGTVVPSGDVQVHTGDVDQQTAWARNSLIFRNTPLSAVFDELSRWYNVRFIGVSPALAQRRLTADWDNRSLESVLQSLSFAFNIKLEHRDGEVEVSR